MTRYLLLFITLLWFEVFNPFSLLGQGCNLKTAVLAINCTSGTDFSYEDGNDCYSEIRMLLEEGIFYDWTANSTEGWVVEQLAPNELLVTYSSGTFPPGNHYLLNFMYYTTDGLPTQLILLYSDECVLEGCEKQHALPGCGESCISGTVYRECNGNEINNQPTLEGFEIQIYDASGNLFAVHTTAHDGWYQVCDLPPGNYFVLLPNDPGWMWSIPASGRYAVELAPDSEEERNFGICPKCTCEDFDVFLHQEPGGGDTTFLYVSIAKNNPFCLERYEIAIDSGDIVKLEILSPGWVGNIEDGQRAELQRSSGVSFPYLGFYPVAKLTMEFGIREQGIRVTVQWMGDGNYPPEPGCQESITVEHPTKYREPTCCPEKFTQGPELVFNGGFGLPILPDTDYTPYISGPFVSGHLGIMDQFQSYAVNNNWNCPGKTNIWDKYLVADAINQANPAAVWRQQIQSSALTPGGEYVFCIQAGNLVKVSQDFTDPRIFLEIKDNNNPLIKFVSPFIDLPEIPKTWVSVSMNWTAPLSLSSSYTFSIYQVNLGGKGNDLAIDCISVRECIAPPQDTCCESLEDFCADLEAGIIFSIDSCKVTMDLSALPRCYIIEWVDWGQGPQFGPWTPFTLPSPMFTFNGNGTYPISYLAIAYNDSNFICLEKVMEDTITVLCNPCVCNLPIMSITTSQASYLLSCNQGVPTTVLPCWAGDVEITGFFGCETISGALCEETVVNYILTGPNGLVDQGTTTPFPSLMYSAGMIGAPGTYSLTLSTLCPGQMDSCVCSLKWIQQACDTCQCRGFTDMFVRGPLGTMNQHVTCGGPPVIITCPAPGKGFHLTGVFQCAGSGCPPNHQIDWSLVHQSSGTTHSGGFQGNNPFFGIYILPTYISQPGLYTLTLTGYCNGDTCSCDVQFIVDCPDLCPCNIADILAFSANVNKGFAVALANKSCKACFSPLAVSDCETVEWFVNSTSGTPIGTSIGSQTFCYTFPFSGTYTIFMVVTRKKPDGTLCEAFTYSQTITVSCIKAPICIESVLPNPGFGEGAVGGILGFGGESSGWIGEGRYPTVIEGPEESDDAWSILLTGCYFNSDALTSAEPICLSGSETGTLSIRLRTPGNPIPGLDVKSGRSHHGGNILVIQLNSKKDPGGRDCDKEKRCKRLAAIEDLLPVEDDDWYDIYIPVDIKEWELEDSCGDQSDGIPVHLKVWMSNMFSSDQGDGKVRDAVILDQICMNGTLVSTSKPFPLSDIRIHPNPTTGIITVILPQKAMNGEYLRVLGLNGQLIMDKSIEVGSHIQTVDLGGCTPGFYLLEFGRAEGRISVHKIVKE